VPATAETVLATEMMSAAETVLATEMVLAAGMMQVGMAADQRQGQEWQVSQRQAHRVQAISAIRHWSCDLPLRR
jgi:hypothetical protein